MSTERSEGTGTFADLDIADLTDWIGTIRLGLMSDGEGCVVRYSVISLPF